jgi:hypothetical protein
MAKYELTMRFTYEIETDDIERTMNEFEFPTFPDLEDDDNKVKFMDNINEWVEIK